MATTRPEARPGQLAGTGEAPQKPTSVKRGAGRIHGSALLPYLMIGPAVVYVLLFQGVPLVQEMRLSLSRTSLLRPDRMTPVGLDNYRTLFADDAFRQTLTTTAIYVVVCVVASIGVGLGSALLLDRAFRGRGLARALVIIPWAAPPVAVALIVTWMLNADYGIINRALGAVGLSSFQQAWLDNPNTALPTILVTTVWQLFPFTAVVLLAALQAVSKDLREASLVDGAHAWGTFRYVVWPTIRPSVSLLTLLMTIWSVRRFELIWLMTQGGPAGSTNTLVIDLYRRAFQFNQLGQAAAVGMVGLAISLTVTALYFWLARRSERTEARA